MKPFYLLLNRLSASFLSSAQLIDPDFANNGRFQPTDGPLMTTRDIEVAPDGKIYALFSIDLFASVDLAAKNSSNGVLYCLLPNGDVFTDFGINGRISIIALDFDQTMVRDLLIASNGDLVICGLVTNASPAQESPEMFRYTNFGNNVSTFGFNGTRVYSLFQGAFMSVAERNTGELVVANDTYNVNGDPTNEDIRIVRMSASGDIDPSFGISGEYLVNTPNREFVKGVLINEYDDVILYGLNYFCPLFTDSSLSNFMIYGDADMNVFEQSGGASTQTGWSPIYDIHDGLISPENEFIGVSNQISGNGTGANPVFHSYNFDDFAGFDQGFLSAADVVRTMTVIEREIAGTYLVSGYTASETETPIPIVSRRNPNGLFNPDFNGGNFFSFSLDKEVQRIRTSAMQSDGSILLGMEAFDIPPGDIWYLFQDIDLVIPEKIAVVVKFIPNCLTAVSIAPFDDACEGGEIKLSAVGTFASFLWSTGDETSTTTVSESGDYILTVSDDNGCSGSVIASVVFNPIPAIPSITQSGNTLTATGTGEFTWTLNGNPISNNSGNTLSVTATGTYAAIVTNSNGCTSEAGSIVVTVVSVDNYALNEWSLYPNPANDLISIQLPGAASFDIQIIDMAGKVVLHRTGTGNSFQLNVSNLAQGMYDVRMTSDKASRKARFIKE